jgi:hypothetical protein
MDAPRYGKLNWHSRITQKAQAQLSAGAAKCCMAQMTMVNDGHLFSGLEDLFAV